MDASLDTDVIIHLYSCERQNLIFSSFDHLYYYEYLFEQELKRKSRVIYDRLKGDTALKQIQIVTSRDLISMDVKSLFDSYLRDYQDLFDTGEMHAVALAKSLGITALVSDDTKEYGPHETLVKELITDVIPFAFYELLFLKYLESLISVTEMKSEFESVTLTSMPKHPMQFKPRIAGVVRRFSNKSGTTRDIDWMTRFCQDNTIDYRRKMLELQNFLNK
jgi:predicted nucleic acid-binding protein